jgi:hypothetical protein
MSRLYASIDSDARKTSATSRGHKRVTTHTRGWAAGVQVEASIIDGRDCFEIYLTGGSNGAQSRQYLGYVQDTDSALGAVFVPVQVEVRP